MKNFYFAFLGIIILWSCKSNTPSSPTFTLESKVDHLVKPYIESTKIAGASIAVYRKNEKVLLKSYGYADLTFKTKLPVDASFEIGSVTKQFTAAAILQLVDSGKINLDEDITKYIKFNTQGHKVTVRQLLSHTSGIKGYTELPFFGQLSVHAYSRDTLLKLVEKEKFDFNPGDALIYNNTGFFMLGLILEKVTGQKYEDYVQKNLFDKAGMTHSYYCSESKIISNKAYGYDTDEQGLVKAGYLDQTWPYAAGSLCSTAEDQVKWDQALHHGKILNEKMYKEFLSPTILNDGTITHYAKGITVTEDHGQTMIEHGGGINGFLSENRYYPNEDLSIVVLVNTTGPVGPGKIADQIADEMFGIPSKDSILFVGDLNQFTGTFQGQGRGEEMKVTIIKKDSSLAIVQEDKTIPLVYSKDHAWHRDREKYIFKGNELHIDQTYGFLILKRK